MHGAQPPYCAGAQTSPRRDASCGRSGPQPRVAPASSQRPLPGLGVDTPPANPSARPWMGPSRQFSQLRSLTSLAETSCSHDALAKSLAHRTGKNNDWWFCKACSTPVATGTITLHCYYYHRHNAFDLPRDKLSNDDTPPESRKSYSWLLF